MNLGTELIFYRMHHQQTRKAADLLDLPPGGNRMMAAPADIADGRRSEGKLMLGAFQKKWYADRAGLELRPWTLTEIRDRLAEAAQTIRRLPMPKDGRPASFKVAWPDVAYDWLAYGWNPTRTPRIPPTPLEISRLDETLDWLHLLTRDQRLILWARANHWSWRKLETLDELERNGRGRTDRQLRNIMHDGEHRILNHLNGTPQRQRIQSHQLQATAKC